MISTHDLSALPSIDALRRLLQSMAMLDAILCPEWHYRYYSFNSKWSAGEQMGSMRDGCGDDFFALFNPSGCWIKGFAHETLMSPYHDDGTARVWPGVLDSVPPEFPECLQEPAFKIADTTFCVWRRLVDLSWTVGEIEFPEGTDPDGSRGLLSALDGRAETYHRWAEGYYERDVSFDAVKAVYDYSPLTSGVIELLNPEVTLAALEPDIAEINFPVA